eukprot:9121231-Lingulodinium_polyedra.AAC.1
MCSYTKWLETSSARAKVYGLLEQSIRVLRGPPRAPRGVAKEAAEGKVARDGAGHEEEPFFAGEFSLPPPDQGPTIV